MQRAHPGLQRRPGGTGRLGQERRLRGLLDGTLPAIDRFMHANVHTGGEAFLDQGPPDPPRLLQVGAGDIGDQDLVRGRSGSHRRHGLRRMIAGRCRRTAGSGVSLHVMWYIPRCLLGSGQYSKRHVLLKRERSFLKRVPCHAGMMSVPIRPTARLLLSRIGRPERAESPHPRGPRARGNITASKWC
ncbi:protein of unknown function [Rhodovastum atsumiense]|nr:protein of unknown function [Rhodovastum atsumiense]